MLFGSDTAFSIVLVNAYHKYVSVVFVVFAVFSGNSPHYVYVPIK